MEDEERVVEEVRRQGGFEYVRLAERAAEGDEFAADAAHDLAWEQLHCAPWHAVHHAWRDAYALSCLRLATHRTDDALRLLDMGLLMGGPLLKPRLHSAITEAQLQQQLHVQFRESESMSPLHEGEFNVAHADRHVDRNMNAVAHVLGNEVGCRIANDDGSELCSHPINCRNQSHSLAPKAYNHFSQVPETVLPHGSLCHHMVSRKKLIPMEDFLCDHFVPALPVIITDAMAYWPAMEKWKNLDYFRDALGHRTIPVEVGEHYLASGWKQELMTMSELLQRFQSSLSPSERPYLAQHPLFEQIPKLREDIFVPDYCAAAGGELKAVNAWFGPSETVTPLHHDPHHNLLSQVIGRKYVRLYSPAEGYGLYPFQESMLSNSSQVDLDNPDYVKFPLAENLSFVDCILEEGEMLYIPPKWWHYVRSLSLSFSVSFWWSDVEE